LQAYLCVWQEKLTKDVEKGKRRQRVEGFETVSHEIEKSSCKFHPLVVNYLSLKRAVLCAAVGLDA